MLTFTVKSAIGTLFIAGAYYCQFLKPYYRPDPLLMMSDRNILITKYSSFALGQETFWWPSISLLFTTLCFVLEIEQNKRSIFHTLSKSMLQFHAYVKYCTILNILEVSNFKRLLCSICSIETKYYPSSVK